MPSLTGLANSLRSDFFPCAGKQSNAKRTASPLTPALSPLRGEGEDFESGRAAIDMPLLRSLGNDHQVRLGKFEQARPTNQPTKERPIRRPHKRAWRECLQSCFDCI